MCEYDEWIGGSEEPPSHGEDENWWFLWETTSSDPCAECQKRDGKLFPTEQPKPHANCACIQQVKLAVCEFFVRQFVNSISWRSRELAGIVPPHSSREFSYGEGNSVSGHADVSLGGDKSPVGGEVGGSSSSSTTSGDTTTINNPTDETIDVYEVCMINTELYLDVYRCTDPFVALPDLKFVEVWHEYAEFLGYDIQ